LSGGSANTCDDGTNGWDDACNVKANCERNSAYYWGSEYYWGGVCTPCASGEVASAAWDDAFDEGKAATCVANICAKDQSVTAGVCADCAPGMRLLFTSEEADTKCYVIATGAATDAQSCTPSAVKTAADILIATGSTWAASTAGLTATITAGTDVPVAAGFISTSGAGTGLALKYTTGTTASITSITVTAAGTGYAAGDTVTIHNQGMPGRATDAIVTLAAADLGTDCDTEARCDLLGATHRWGTSATANAKTTACQWSYCKDNEHWTGTACATCAAGKTLAGDVCLQSNMDTLPDDTSCGGANDGTGTVNCNDGGKAVCEAVTNTVTTTTRVAGTYVWAKKLAAATATTCTATNCAVNEYVSSNVCTPCAPGTARAAGDDASLTDTACTAWTCPKDFHVRNNFCVACVVGKSNAAGDDASAGDTTCDVINCNTGTDQAIVDGVCTSCATGTTTTGLAGDRFAWIAAPTAGAC
jgi:hypothetical protein